LYQVKKGSGVRGNVPLKREIDFTVLVE